MNISGYAFKPNADEIRANYRKAYQAALQYKDQIEIKKAPDYAHVRFHGEFLTAEAKENLNELAICLLADNGNLCFGGDCQIRGDHFQGTYNTD